MNEHGIYHMVNNKKGDRIAQSFTDEKSIFEFLGIEWREPKDRIDGNSYQLIDDIAAKGKTEQKVEPKVKKQTKKSTKKRSPALSASTSKKKNPK